MQPDYRLRRHPPLNASAITPLGAVPAPHQAGRTTAALECPQGRGGPDDPAGERGRGDSADGAGVILPKNDRGDESNFVPC